MISGAATDMKAPARKLISRLQLERVQEKGFLLEERRLFMAQICPEGETEAPVRTWGLKRKTECIQSKPFNEAQKKRRRMKITEELVPVQEKSVFLAKPATLPDEDVRKGRSTETHNRSWKQTRNTCGLKKKAEDIEKEATLVDSNVKKDRPTHKLIPAQEKRKTKPGLTKKTVWAQENSDTKTALTKKTVENPMILADGVVKTSETINQPEKNFNTGISSKRSEKEEENKRVLCEWRSIKAERERQKQREAARLALNQLKNTCRFQDNMDSVRDFEKIVGCSLTFYVFSRDANGYD